MFKKILLPLNLQETELAKKAVAFAIKQAQENGGEITILTVLPGFGMPMVASFFPDDTVEKALRLVAKELKKYIANTFPENIKVHARIAEGHPSEHILDQAKKVGADLIVIPSHTKSVPQKLLGACSNKVVEQSPCSVMVIKA